MIPLFKVYMSEEAGPAANAVLYSGYVGEGEKVKEFEAEISDIINNDNVLAVNSGTSAITLSLRLAGVKQGDYVISTPMTCLATNEPILSLGATPIWCDAHSYTGNITPHYLQECINNNLDKLKKIKTIICTHWGGNPCDVNGINMVADIYDIPVIEDAAQAFGASFDCSKIGTHSEYVCFSFGAIKYVTSVDGGAIAFRDADTRERARLMRWFGLDREKGASMRCAQDPIEPGYKYQMNDVNAAIGIENSKSLPYLISSAALNAERYIKELQCANIPKQNDSIFWFFNLSIENVPEFITFMRNKEIMCSSVHGRNDTKAIFASSKTSLPGVDYFSKHEVAIPCGWWLSKDDVTHIIKSINEYCKGE